MVSSNLINILLGITGLILSKLFIKSTSSKHRKMVNENKQGN